MTIDSKKRSYIVSSLQPFRQALLILTKNAIEETKNRNVELAAFFSKRKVTSS
jgi:hypothetical protein